MQLISHDPVNLITQAQGPFQYPDGFCLSLETMFAPIEDRDTPRGSFTPKLDNTVLLSNPRLGCLENVVAFCDAARHERADQKHHGPETDHFAFTPKGGPTR